MKRPRDLFGHVIKGPREDAIQAAIVQLLRLAADRRTIYLAIPNGIPASPRIGARFVKHGLLAGAPDLLIITPDGRTNFLEVKAPDGRQSDAQKDFQARCSIVGVHYRVVRSISEAEETLRDWGALRGRAVDNSSEPASDNWESLGAVLERVVSKLDRQRKNVA
jgi:hypothetical protein